LERLLLEKRGRTKMQDFITYIMSMDFKDWGFIGIILFVLHLVFSKSQILKWTGIGAILISCITIIKFDIGWQAQWVIFLTFIIWGLSRNRGASV